MNRIISALLLALAAGLLNAAPLQIAENAPARHVVVPGDTLWGISARFLREPWRWPEIWRMNKAQIANPHLIYPGDVIVLTHDDQGEPVLQIETTRLQPKIRSEAVTQTVPSIPPGVIEPFLSEPRIIDSEAAAGSARIVAMPEGRVFLGAGDTAFVSGASDRPKQDAWQLYRPAKPLLDPDTREVLGYEAFYLGTARQLQPGEPGVFQILTAKQEVGRGDHLLPATRPQLINYMPHRPDKAIEGRIASVYGGVGGAGRNSVIALNRGQRDGLEIGHVLALHRDRSDTFRNPETGRMETLRLPDQRYGLVFVFRVFDRIAYALILDSEGPASIGDLLRQP